MPFTHRAQGEDGAEMKPCRGFTRDRRKASRPKSLAAATLAGLIGIGVCPAGAQDAGDRSGLQILVTPYFWAPEISAKVKTPAPGIPDVNANVSFSQLFHHLSWIPFFGSAELRNDRYGVFVDYMHVPVRTGFDTRNALFSGGTAGLVLDVATVDFLYRPLAQPQQYLDAGFGVRPWGVSTDISFNSGLLPATSVSTGGSWADPLIILRYHRELGSGFGLTAYGDVGGFGLAAHTDWQVIGTVDYTITSWIDLHVGYRSLNVNYSTKNDVGFNVNMDGPIIAGTFHF